MGQSFRFMAISAWENVLFVPIALGVVANESDISI